MTDPDRQVRSSPERHERFRYRARLADALLAGLPTAESELLTLEGREVGWPATG